MENTWNDYHFHGINSRIESRADLIQIMSDALIKYKDHVIANNLLPEIGPFDYDFWVLLLEIWFEHDGNTNNYFDDFVEEENEEAWLTFADEVIQKAEVPY